jgi:predicted protein tyrosine phosphatase
MESSFFSNTSGVIYAIYKVTYDKTIASFNSPKDMNVKRLHNKPVIQSIYEHISAPIRSMVHIIDNIYIGNAYNASNYTYLMENNIKCIVNATDEIDNYFEYDKNLSYLKLNGVLDNSSSSIKNYFNDFIKFIEENKEHNMLIHCYMGSSRSATLVVLYLVYFKKYYIDDAITFVETRCNRVNINIIYIKELTDYIKMI